MAEDSNKARAFVQRLLANPALKGLTPLQQEEQILQFLQINGQKLYPTLASPGFFPGKPWEEIRYILVLSLMESINPGLFRQLENAVSDSIQMTFLEFISQARVDSDELRRQLLEFLKNVISKPEVRREYSGVLTAIGHSAVDKYIDQVYMRREYAYFELTKVQRLRMSKEEVKQLIRVTMLLKPVVAEHNMSGAVQTEGSAILVQPQFVEMALPGLKNRLPLMPEPVLKASLNSSTSFLENRYLEATARIAAIFCSLFKNYRSNFKQDRGADSPEKSWINIARRNFRYYGYDIKMLDEFYKIAAENGW